MKRSRFLPSLLVLLLLGASACSSPQGGRVIVLALDGVDPVFLAEVTMLASALASAYAEPLEAPVGGCACSGMGPIWGGWWLGLLVLPWSFVSRNPRDPR